MEIPGVHLEKLKLDNLMSKAPFLVQILSLAKNII